MLKSFSQLIKLFQYFERLGRIGYDLDFPLFRPSIGSSSIVTLPNIVKIYFRSSLGYLTYKVISDFCLLSYLKC